MVFKFNQRCIKFLQISMGPKSVLIFSMASVIAELLEILWFFSR